MDGHTSEGSYKVTLHLTGDMVEQLVRLLDMAKMMDGREYNPNDPQRMDVLAYRAFLEDILVILRDAIDREQLG